MHEELLVGLFLDELCTLPLSRPSFTSPWAITLTAASCGSFQWLPGRAFPVAACCAASTTS